MIFTRRTLGRGVGEPLWTGHWPKDQLVDGASSQVQLHLQTSETLDELSPPTRFIIGDTRSYFDLTTRRKTTSTSSFHRRPPQMSEQLNLTWVLPLFTQPRPPVCLVKPGSRCLLGVQFQTPLRISHKTQALQVKWNPSGPQTLWKQTPSLRWAS